MEYKNKLLTITTIRYRNIVSEHMASKKLKILDLSLSVDRDAFKLIIPEINYRLQVMHKQVILDACAKLFVVGSTWIEFAVIFVMSQSITYW